MNNLKHWILLLVFTAMPAAAFDFTPSSANYDFTQTVEILIVDQHNSKIFAMRDPFEMLMTTSPSRFYAALMGALMRGHHNGEGVVQLDGTATGVDYVLLFKSLNSTHILLVGKHWLQDGSKKILLTTDEVMTIYEVLQGRAQTVEPTDLKKWELVFKEFNELQDANDVYPKLTSDDELKSMMEAKKSLEQRLPESHDDMKTLPYYNKAEENRKFLEELNAKQAEAQTLNTPQAQADRTETPSTNTAPEINSKITAPKRATNPPPMIAPEDQTSNQSKNSLFLGICIAIGLALVTWVGFKRVMR